MDEKEKNDEQHQRQILNEKILVEDVSAEDIPYEYQRGIQHRFHIYVAIKLHLFFIPIFPLYVI
jgi:hypothetical protein